MDHHPAMFIIETILTVFVLTIWVSRVKISLKGVPEGILIFLAGMVSLFFDSFAVILIIANGLILTRVKGVVLLSMLMQTALAVGAAFYLGEVYSLPFYISNGKTGLFDGLPVFYPLMAFNITYSIASHYVLKLMPGEDEKFFIEGKWDSIGKFVAGLVFLVVTQNVLMALGITVLYALAFKKTDSMVHSFHHEFKEGGWMVFGILLIGLGLSFTGISQTIHHASGWEITKWASLSSPLTGSLLGHVEPAMFHSTLAYLILGSMIFFFSSLVGIMALKAKEGGILYTIRNWVIYEVVAVLTVPQLAFWFWVFQVI